MQLKLPALAVCLLLTTALHAQRINIAPGKVVTASSEETKRGNLIAHAIDGDANTRWCAVTHGAPQWYQVDLGKPTEITGVSLLWETPDATYNYTVDGSADAAQWSTLVDAKAGAPGKTTHNFEATPRYVRVNFIGKGKPGAGWASIRELAVLTGKSDAKELAALAEQQQKHKAQPPAPVTREGNLVAAGSSGTLSEVKVTPGFDVTLFAEPPMMNYPTFVAADVDGTLYVSSDKNGSTQREPHRGRIIRLRDTDGDGKADEQKVFVPDVDSPRGLFFDHDRVYLVHPPHLSAFIDKNGDGVADEEKVLVKGIAFDFKDRPADHTTNGLTMGIDGWLYIAGGDFGFMHAEGADGRKLQMRGGGVYRVRPDGTGLEIYARGTRNIYQVAVDPLLNAFARDNTNDGGGWDTRFHHFTGFEHHGYPSLFRNFADEAVPYLADYGGGSGVGGLYVSEPGFPGDFGHMLYSCDWGRSFVYAHPLKPAGSTFSIEQQEFLSLNRVTDMDVDGSSRLYASSWKGAVFSYAGENVGYIVRLSPKGYKPEPVPDFDKLSETELVKQLTSPSHRRRLAAQRTLLRKGSTLPGVAEIARDEKQPLEVRVAAIFTLKQGLGEKSHGTLIELMKDATIREWAIRALADRIEQNKDVSIDVVTPHLADKNPRVRLAAVIALGRIGKAEAGPALVNLLGDPDAVIAHTVINVLANLKAVQPALGVIDSPGASSVQRVAATRVLQQLHDPAVVDALVQRLDKAADSGLRFDLFNALCRLYNHEGEWTGNSWGTRPDTSGPYYQPEPWEQSPKIATALRRALNGASSSDQPAMFAAINRNKVQMDDLLPLVLSIAAKDPSMVPVAITQIARGSTVPAEAMGLLIAAAEREDLKVDQRADLMVALSKASTPEAFGAMLVALPKQPTSAGREYDTARDALLNAPKLAVGTDVFAAAAAKMDGKSSLWAEVALLTIATKKDGGAAKQVVEAGWSDSKRHVQMLKAIGQARIGAYKDRVIVDLKSEDKAIAGAAKGAAGALRIDVDKKGQTAPLIATMKIPDVIKQVVATKGDVKLGEELFTRQGCVACHTVRADDPPRGPYLGTITSIYKRPDLAENILDPNKTIAQGFATNSFDLKDGSHIDGFVTSEGAEKVSVRNIAGQEFTFKTSDIVKRVKLEISMMPPGLVAGLTIKEFASLLDYLESLNK